MYLEIGLVVVLIFYGIYIIAPFNNRLRNLLIGLIGKYDSGELIMLKEKSIESIGDLREVFFWLIFYNLAGLVFCSIIIFIYPLVIMFLIAFILIGKKYTNFNNSSNN